MEIVASGSSATFVNTTSRKWSKQASTLLIMLPAVFALTGCGGSSSSSTTQSNPAPMVTISIQPATITYGQTATINWSTSNASACTATGAWNGAQAVNGSQSISPIAAGPATYMLSCTGAGGSASKSVNLTVQIATAPAPKIPVQVSSTTFTLNGDDISSIASGDLFGDGSQTIIIGSETYSTSWTTTSQFSALKLTSAGQISDVSNTFLDQSQPGPVLSRKIVIGDFNHSGHLGFFSANTGPDTSPFGGELNSLFLWNNGMLMNNSASLPGFDAYTHTAAATGTNLLVGISPPYGYLGAVDPPQYGGPNVIFKNGSQGAGYYAGPYMLQNLGYNNTSLPSTILPPGGDYVTEAEFLNASSSSCPDLVLGLNIADSSVKYVPAPTACNGNYSASPIAVNAGIFGSQQTITLGLAAVPLTNSGRNDIIDVSTSQTPFYGIGKLQILVNNGNGQFTDDTSTRLPADEGVSASDNQPEYSGETEFWYRWVYTADLENRGCNDIVAWGGHGNTITGQQTIFLNNCDGSNTFRHPTPVEAPMLPYDLYPVNIASSTYLVQFQYPLGSTPPFTVTVNVWKW